MGEKPQEEIKEVERNKVNTEKNKGYVSHTLFCFLSFILFITSLAVIFLV